MSDKTTRRMLAVYEQMAPVLMFLSGYFKSPAGNFHQGEEVEIDIVRGDEDVAVVVTDLSTGYRLNQDDLYTNKSFKPPIFKEAFAINSHDLLRRQAGQNPFQDPDFRFSASQRMMAGMVKVSAKIRRAMELQASQVLQTGKLSLTDSAGVARYGLDFKPKTSHFPTASVGWDTATGKQKLDQIDALAEVIRNDGLQDPNKLILGKTALESLVSDSTIQSRLDTRRVTLGNVTMNQPRGNGGTYRGELQIGNYVYELWTYGARYKDPQTGNKVKYVDDEKIIVMGDGRLDASFGAIPNIGKLLGANRGGLLPEIPSRISSADGSIDLHTNVWLSEDGETLYGGVGARPLMIPTAIDTFGCLDVDIT